MFSLLLVFFFCSPVAFFIIFARPLRLKSSTSARFLFFLFLCVCVLGGRGNLRHTLLATKTVMSVFVQQEESAMSHLPQ